VPSVVPVLNHYFLWGHRQPVLSAHSVHSLVFLSQEQVPSLHIQYLPNRLRFTLQQKIASAAHSHSSFLCLILSLCDILVRIWILLFSSVTFKTATKNLVLKFFAYYFFKVHLHRFSKIKSHKEVTEQ
jgi:hypothetical protein